MRIRRRILSLALCLCLVLTLLPMSVLADNTNFTGGMTAAMENGVLWLFANGTAVTIEAKGTGTAIYADNNDTKTEIDLTSVTSSAATKLTTDGTNGYDLSAVVVCGGSNAKLGTSDSSSSTSVTMTGGTVGALVGGCYNATLYGSTNVKLTGGTLNGGTLNGAQVGTSTNPQAIVGGGVGAASVSGDTHVSISGGTIAEFNKDMYVLCTAGCWKGSSDAPLPAVANAYLTITGSPTFHNAFNHICMTYNSTITNAYLNITPSAALANEQIYARGDESTGTSVTSANILTNNKNCIRTSGNDGFTSDAHYLTVDTTNTNYDFTSVNTTFTLGTDYTIPAGYTMTIPAGVTLTIPSGVTVTNNGSIVINGTLANNGTISGGSIVKQQSGTYTPGSGATPQTVDIVVTDFTSLTIAAGTTRGTTIISAIDTITTSGDAQYYKLFDIQPAAPSGSTAAISDLSTYTSVSANAEIAVHTGQYLAVYELDSGGKIVKYRCTPLTNTNISGSTAYDSLTDKISSGVADNTTKITAAAGSGETLYYKLGDDAEGTGYVYNTPITVSTDMKTVTTDADIPATAGQYLSVYEVTTAEPHLLHGFACVKMDTTHFTAYTGGLVADTTNQIIYCNGKTVCMSAETYDSTAHTGSEPMLYVLENGTWKAATPKNLSFSGGTDYAGYTLSSKSGTSDTSTTKSGTLYLISNPYYKYSGESFAYTALPKVDDSWANAIYPTKRASTGAETMTDKNCTDYTVIGAIDPSASKQTHLYNYANAKDAIYTSVSTAARTRANNSVKRMDINSLTVANGGTFTVPSTENGVKPSDTFKILFFGNKKDSIKRNSTGTTKNIQNMIFMPKVSIKLYRADTMKELPYTTRTSGEIIESTGNKIYQIPNNISVTIVATFAANETEASISAAPSTQTNDTTDKAAGSQIPLMENYALGFYVATTESERNLHFWYYTNDKLKIDKSTDTAGDCVTTVSVTVKDLQKYTEFTKKNSSVNTWNVFADVSNITDDNTSFANYIPPRYFDTRWFCQFELLKSEQTPLTVSGLDGRTYGDQNFKLSVGGGSSNGAVTYSVPDNNGVLSTDGSTLTAVGAGKTKVTVIKAGDDTYEPVTKTVELTVAKKAPASSDLTMTPPSNLTYDISDKAATVAVKAGLTGFGTVSKIYYTGVNGTSYAKSEAAPINAGTYQVSVDLEAGDNYTVATGIDVGKFTIAKATNYAAPTIKSIDDDANTLIFQPAANISGYEFSVDGGRTWKDCNDTNSTVPCTIHVGNIAGTVQVRAKETANYTGQIATSAAFTAALEGSVSITGTAKFGETLTANVTGAQSDAVFTYQWKADGTDIPGASEKTYTSTIDRIGKTITVVVSAAPSYVGTLTSAATAAVAKGDPTGAPAYKTVSVSGKKLADAALAIGTLAPSAEGYKLIWVDADGKTLADTTEIKANASYKWLFTPADTVHYIALSGSVTLYPVSSGGESPDAVKITTDTKTNADGSVTKTETAIKTDSTGAVTKTETQTTTAKDGTTTKVETVKVAGGTDGVTAEAKIETDKSGSAVATALIEAPATATATTLPAAVVTAVTAADAAKVTVKVGEVSVALDKTAVEAVKATGGEAPIISATPVAAKDLPADLQGATKAYDFKVSGKGVNFGGGSAVVSVPYTKTDSTKAVAVYHIDASGNKTRIYDVTLTAGKLNISTVGWSTYAVMEVKPLAFTDVKESDWFYGSVACVLDNHLFKGTSAAAFSPSASMTRQQMWMVLARMAGQTPAIMADAQSWAVTSKVSDGSNGAAAVTRQQFVTLLWRAAGSPKAVQNMDAYTDFTSVGGYAKNAMIWAVNNGILSGTSATTLSPKDSATRAQIAVILTRYIHQKSN